MEEKSESTTKGGYLSVGIAAFFYFRAEPKTRTAPILTTTKSSSPPSGIEAAKKAARLVGGKIARPQAALDSRAVFNVTLG